MRNLVLFADPWVYGMLAQFLDSGEPLTRHEAAAFLGLELKNITKPKVPSSTSHVACRIMSHVAHECSHVYRGGHSSTNTSTAADLIRLTPTSMFQMHFQVKKQYLHLSKSVHPDKTDRRREGAFTRRFQMLGKAKGVFIHR